MVGFQFKSSPIQLNTFLSNFLLNLKLLLHHNYDFFQSNHIEYRTMKESSQLLGQQLRAKV